MLVEVKVTQDDIDNGVPDQPCRCPVARALKRLGYDNVYVWYDEITVQDSNTKRYLSCHSIPGDMEYFVRTYDEEELAQPAFFIIELKESEWI